MPRNESCFIDRIHDRTFKLNHHFEVIVILDVVALNDGDLAVHHHEF